MEALESQKPKLWHPGRTTAYAILCGALLAPAVHALNWITLREGDRARANVLWLLLGIGFILVIFPFHEIFAKLFNFIYLGTWYFL